jgi:thiol-disulfide isomerase/thioredoxin
MTIQDYIKKYRNIITIALSLLGIGIMVCYSYCGTTCSYLKGDIWGIDLKWVGIAYMAVIIAFAAFRQTPFVRAMLAAGLGVEVHLYAFQVQNNVYCPFCLAFSVMLILSFLINYEAPSAWRANRCRMWLYFLGEVDFPMFKINKLPLLLFSLLGYLTILFTFSGAVTPAYGFDSAGSIPSLGKGPYEVVIFADYFCPPCKRIDIKAEPLLKELLATNKVKITFIDVPFHSITPIYAKYYLYAANASPDVNAILHARKTLFEAAQIKNIQKENALVDYLKEQKILWKKLDEKSIFPVLSAVIKENNIDQTPTCIIKYSATDAKKYIGDDKIWDGLTALKTHISAGEK